MISEIIFDKHPQRPTIDKYFSHKKDVNNSNKKIYFIMSVVKNYQDSV
jgi:hypothetical protein